MTTIKLNWKFILLFLLFILADTLVILATFEMASYFRENVFAHGLPEFRKYSIEKFSWVIIITLMMLVYEKIYFKRYDFWTDMKKILKALFFSFITVLSVIALTKSSHDYSRSFILIFFLFASITIPFFKRFLKWYLFKLKIFKLKVTVIADKNKKRLIRKEIKANWYMGYIFNDKNFDVVLISSEGFDINKLDNLIKKFSRLTKDVYLIPYLNTINYAQAEIIEYFNTRSSTINIENRLLVPHNIYIKNIVEMLMILFILPVFLFIHCLISILIKIDSAGPVIFKQKRLGKDERVFNCYKYRSMYIDGDIILKKYLENNPEEIAYYDTYHKYKNDPRITSVGKVLRKTSLDELPQLINVLQRKMSLIGPRPYMLEEKEKLMCDIKTILHVKPGITGLWQVSGRNELDFEERKKIDSWYIRNWSLWLDFVILIKTIKVVLSKAGAS